MEASFLILLIAFLIFCSAYFSGSEVALFSLPATRIKSYKTDADPKKRLIAYLLSRPQDLLVTVFILNTLVNILLQNVAANLFGDFSSWILKVGVPLVLTLIFGEIIPKYIGLQYNFAFSYQVAPSINILQNILKPIRKLTIAITTPLSRLMFFFLKKGEPISNEEIEHILITSEQHGIFSPDEGELILGYLQLQDAILKELMRPREDILYYNIHDPISKLTYLFDDLKCSRVPVCDKDLDSVLGIMTARQYLLHRNQIQGSDDLSPFLSKPFYVPETMLARLLLRRFHDQRQKLALVVNEYGSICGLLTHEDLIEVVVGEIADSRDQTHLYTKAGENEIIASGKLELETFNELFKVNLISPGNMVTIGGWLTERLEEIPKSGSKFEMENFLFQILSATPSRIRRLYIRKLRNSH